MAIFIPRWERYKKLKPTTSQEFDWNNPLAEGIKAFIYEGNAVAGVMNAVNGRIFTPSGTLLGSTSKFDRDGVNTTDNVISSYFSDTSTDYDVVDQLFTLSMVDLGLLSATLSEVALIRKNNIYALGVYPSYHKIRVLAKTTGTTGWTDQNDQIVGFKDNTLHTIANAYKNGIGSKVYFEGKLVATLPVSGNIYQSTEQLTVCGGTVTKAPLGGQYLTILGNKYKTADEIAVLTENPYQLLKPRRKWFVFGATATGTTVTLDGATSQSLADSIALTQTHELVADNALSSAVVDSLPLSQTQVIFADGSISTAMLDTTTITQTHELAADSLLSTSFADSLLLTQTQDITLDSSLSQAFADAIVVQVANAITVALSDSTSTAQSDSLSVLQTQLIQLSSSLSTSEISSLQATQTHLIAFADAISSGFADTVTVSQGAVTTVTLSDSISQSSIDSLVLTQSQIITLDGTESSATIGDLNLTQTQEIVLSNSQAQAFADALQIIGVGLGKILNPSVKLITLTKDVTAVTSKLSIKHLN